MLTGPRIQVAILGLLAAGLAVGGFHAGRHSVDAAALSKGTGETQVDSPNHSQRQGILADNPLGQGSVREIATVPFSELYDVLRAAPGEQLLAWARDLERMPRGPRQRAAVTAYYKSLIQVDHRAAIEAILHAQNLPMRDVAIDAMTKASPESIWAEVAEMTMEMPYPGRGFIREDLIKNWSRVDPVAASQFIERHPFSAEQKLPDGEDGRVVSLLNNWGEIDPSAARSWLEADASRHTKDALRAFVTSWGRADPAGAINYAVANAHEPKFEGAINELVYQFVRSAKEDATRLIWLLPPERAKAAMKNVADITSPEVIDSDRPPDYQRPPDEIAHWMVSLPAEFWNESIGVVAREWLNRDAFSAKAWLDQFPPETRDVVILGCFQAAKTYRISAEQVMELGLTISDHRLRDTVLGELVRSIQTTTPGAMSAVERINELSISEEQKAYLRGFITERGNGR
jgi:hypothetical protein